MTDRERVIRGLECYTTRPTISDREDCDSCDSCDYYISPDGLAYCDVWTMMEDALALLKALEPRVQEPRVMMLDEVKVSEKPIWLEWRHRFIKPAFLHSDQVMTDDCRNAITFVLFGKEEWYIYADDDYGVEVRCWTSRPTDAQREATPWN